MMTASDSGKSAQAPGGAAPTATVKSGSNSVKAKSTSFDELAKYFHMPINDAAKELGICATVLKELCRRRGIQRWPHRKLKAIDRLIEKYEREQSTALDQTFYQNEIHGLKQKKESILRHYRGRSQSKPQSPAEEPAHEMAMYNHGPVAAMAPNGRAPSVSGVVPQVAQRPHAPHGPHGHHGPHGLHAGHPPHPHHAHGDFNHQSEQAAYDDCVQCQRTRHQVAPTMGYYGQMIPVHQMQGYYPPRSASTRSAENGHMQGSSQQPPAQEVPAKVGGPEGAGMAPFPHKGNGMYAMGGPVPEMYPGQFGGYPSAVYPPHAYYHNVPSRGAYQYQSVPYPQVVMDPEQNQPQMVGHPRDQVSSDGKVLPPRPHGPTLDVLHTWQMYSGEVADQSMGKDERGFRGKAKHNQVAMDVSNPGRGKEKTSLTTTIDSRKTPQAVDAREQEKVVQREKLESGAAQRARAGGPTPEDQRGVDQETHGRATEGARVRPQAAQMESENSSVGENDKQRARGVEMYEPLRTDDKRKTKTTSDAKMDAMTESKRNESDPNSLSGSNESPSRVETVAENVHQMDEALNTSKLTIWIMDSSLKVMAREGPAQMAFHGEIPKIGENVVEQVQNNRHQNATLLLEPYVQARDGMKAERSYWSQGRKYLQHCSPIGSSQYVLSVICPAPS